MAIGLGLMFGFHFPENFNYPYISQSIQEFWRRWHISLSTWFRDYLYIPLGGNRKGALRTYFNLVTVFFLCGLWHGASWNFAFWGLYHGFFLVIERLGFARLIAKHWRPFQHGYTLLVVMVGWVLFRAETFTQTCVFLKAMAGFGAASDTTCSVMDYWNRELAIVLLLAFIGATPWMPAVKHRFNLFQERAHPTLRLSFHFVHEWMVLGFLGLVFMICAMLISAQTHNPFIYFRF